MVEFLGELGDVLTDLSPGVVVGSLMIALTLALVGSGIHALTWGRKGPTPIAPLCGLMFLVSVVSMAVAAGYVRPSRREAQGRPGRLGYPPHSVPRGRAIFEAGEIDLEGPLTRREALELDRRANVDRSGSADRFDLDSVSLPERSAPRMVEEPDALTTTPPGLGLRESSPPLQASFPLMESYFGHDT